MLNRRIKKSASIGRGLQDRIDTANLLYRSLNLAMLDRIETKMVPSGIAHPATKQMLFRPSDPVFGDVTGWYRDPQMIDGVQRVAILGELKSRTTEFRKQKSKRLRSIPRIRKKNGRVLHSQVQTLDEALTYPRTHVILVLEARFSTMDQPTLATIPWSFDDQKIDAEVLQHYAVPFRKGVWDYLGLLGGQK